MQKWRTWRWKAPNCPASCQDWKSIDGKKALNLIFNNLLCRQSLPTLVMLWWGEKGGKLQVKKYRNKKISLQENLGSKWSNCCCKSICKCSKCHQRPKWTRICKCSAWRIAVHNRAASPCIQCRKAAWKQLQSNSRFAVVVHPSHRVGTQMRRWLPHSLVRGQQWRIGIWWNEESKK